MKSGLVGVWTYSFTCWPVVRYICSPASNSGYLVSCACVLSYLVSKDENKKRASKARSLHSLERGHCFRASALLGNLLYLALPFRHQKDWSEVKVAQLCLTFLRPLGLYRPWASLGQNTGVGSLSLLQGIFPTQGLNPGLPHCRRILYQLSCREAQKDWYWWIRESLKWGKYSLSCTDIWITADGLWRRDFSRDPRKGQLNFMTLRGTCMVESYRGERRVLCADKLGCESSLCPS